MFTEGKTLVHSGNGGGGAKGLCMVMCKAIRTESSMSLIHGADDEVELLNLVAQQWTHLYLLLAGSRVNRVGLG